jgi:hypothetical protein
MSDALPDVHHERNILAWSDSAILGQPVAASRREDRRSRTAGPHEEGLQVIRTRLVTWPLLSQ